MNKVIKYIKENSVIIMIILAVMLVFASVHYLRFISFETQFEKDFATLKTSQFLKDDFENYSENSKILNLSSANDLSRWQDKGLIVGFVNIDDWKNISSVDLELCDEKQCHTLKGVANNLELERKENTIFGDEAFTDYDFGCDQNNSKWRDFMLVNGKNIVFWQWNKSLNLNMDNVTAKTTSPVEKLVMQREFCQSNNPTNGNWYSPHGLLQYGYYYTENGRLFLSNIRQTQMVSNGDHARILTKEKLPKDFIMRVVFTPTDIPQKNFRIADWVPPLKYYIQPVPSSLKNNYVRIGYDFEDVKDAGHDQSLVYSSLEYNYFGVQRVYPIITQTRQGYEDGQKKSLKLKNNHSYEIDLRVEGQNITTSISDLGRYYNLNYAKISYTFLRQRLKENYPLSIEATGDVQISIDEVEILEINNKNAA